ncbi:MAG TPA: inositol monophosphatase [Chloroflexota bacterium]|nr:inositol monophosphatase [Chloroflexota bacterium]
MHHLRTMALAIREAVSRGIRISTAEELSREVGDRGGDTIFRIDEHGEEALLAHCAAWSEDLPFLLVAEGLEEGARIFPAGAEPHRLAFTLIVDPIDGTRELMYGKRSAWALFGVAPPPRAGRRPTLDQIGVALQAELPTARAALADLLWAARGAGVDAETHDLRDGTITPFIPRPSQAATLRGGFAAISKFFPGAKPAAAAIEEALFLELLGPPPTESPQVFDDQYISSGGQLYELTVGHDRFLADLRPLLHAGAGTTRLCCHPYDLCTELIAREAGVRVTDPQGAPLAAPLDTESNVAWVGYANQALQSQIEPILHRLLQEDVHKTAYTSI